ncbi:MAG TPA: tetratricopeptide repeat protein [Usitatibacter sp.]|nr:tetratricopeptide repeat protein [Usitatibacter sp.]
MARKSIFGAIAVVAALALGPVAAQGDDMAPLEALAKREAAGGNAGARAMVSLLSGARDKDTTVKAFEWLQDAANRGRPEAQFQLAFQYETAPAPDFRRAFAWYLKAAEQGNTMAQSNLATMFLFGKGVKRDPQQAVAWSLKAAEKGNAVSQARLGAMYAAGDGVPQDALMAEHWLVRAAEQGYAPAQAHLGSMFFNGESGAEKDVRKGLYWLKRAAEQHQPMARKLLDQAIKDNVPGARDPLAPQK